ncbi:MAG: hypothetical protein VX640_09920 [Pseudomonadota bacterium]|nr:hypothetical protein [Pseudomonadota bacterium]
MTDPDIAEARGDLAFMRSLVNGGGQFQTVAGEIFIWAGLLYGLQCLANWLDVVGVVKFSQPAMLAVSFGPTFVFLAVLGVVIWRERKAPKSAGSSRALEAVFQGAGIANLVLAVVFAYGAHLTQSITVWLYHPVVVCVFQGVAWYVAWTVRKRAWLGLVSLGWFAVSIACGVLIESPDKFLLTLGVALFVLMAIPGYAMMRAGKQAA